MSRSVVLNFTAMSSASEEDGWTGEVEVSDGWDNTAISSADDENRWTGEKVALFTWVDSLSSLANNPSKAEKLSLTLSSLRY